jgi:anhydro-N-acetylmuramic acid kinase
MRIAGVMSGTSLDGIDVAIIKIEGRKIEPIAFRSIPYPRPVRDALLAVLNAATHPAEISRLNFLLGELYAEAVIATCRRARLRLDSVRLIGLHGQTVFHEGAAVNYLGRRVASTLQIGEAAVVAERTGIRVVSNFRERDVAAGGRGAPLVPFVDYLLFRHRTICRVALNIGGIANITVLKPGAKPEEVIAYDTGPGNMTIDALVRHMTGGRENCDRGGRIARSGKVNRELFEELRSRPYFKLKAPKTAGREQFGEEFVRGLIATGLSLPDLIATATELTAWTIARAILDSASESNVEVIASGGGVHNRWLMQRLHYYLNPSKIRSTAEFGIDPDAKEAIAFAVLAYRTFRREPGNLPSATGARRAAILGKSTLP